MNHFTLTPAAETPQPLQAASRLLDTLRRALAPADAGLQEQLADIALARASLGLEVADLRRYH